jgi:DNA-binding CsgD family transcriptional regulator
VNSPERTKVGYEALLKNSSEIITYQFYNAAKQTYHYYLFVIFCNTGISPKIDKLINLVPLMNEVHKLLHEKIQKTIPWLPTKKHLNSKLTATEQTVMAWVRLGKTDSEIGQILGVRVFTAKNHLANIFKKLNVVSRAQAVAETTQKDI